MNYLNVLLALGGWIVAGTQFFVSLRETRRKQESELLERTLGYFGDGPIRRSIGISLVQSIWTRNDQQLTVIIPVLVAQLNYLLLEAQTESRVEERNLIRILDLLRGHIDKASDPGTERIEVLEALNAKLYDLNRGVPMVPTQLKGWYRSFGGNAEHWAAESEKAEEARLSTS
jgi:hypothetical protein